MDQLVKKSELKDRGVARFLRLIRELRGCLKQQVVTIGSIKVESNPLGKQGAKVIHVGSSPREDLKEEATNRRVSGTWSRRARQSPAAPWRVVRRSGIL
jgi:hypothetical protein